MARHKWTREQQRGETCARCGVVRHYVPREGRLGAKFNYEWLDGRREVRPENSGYVPPCPGAPESKKEER